MAVLALLQLGFVFGTKIALRLHHHGSRPQPFPANPVLQLQTSADLKEALDPPVEEPFNSCFISSSPGAPFENQQCALLATKLLGTSPEGRAL